MRSIRKSSLAIGGTAVTCAILVVVSATLFDRPVATWVHEHLGDRRFGWFTATYDGHLLTLGPFSLMAAPAQALAPIAAFVFAVLALAALTGWRPGIQARIVLAICLAVFAVTGINTIAKMVFGRTWPESWMGDNPSWISRRRIRVFPVSPRPRMGLLSIGPHRGNHNDCHHPLAGLARTDNRLGLLVATVVVGLIGANYHFVSDIIGGLYLGVAIGLGMAALTLSPNDRLLSSNQSS